MARVIKGARVIARPLVDAREDAARIVEAAHAEAARVVRDARAELERAAREAARAELAAAHLEVERARDQLLEETREEVGTLAIAVARRAIGIALEERPEHVRALVDEALTRVRRARQVRVRVHPEDARYLDGIALVTDDTLARGDCVVESELGEVDARIETRVEALARVLSRRDGGR